MPPLIYDDVKTKEKTLQSMTSLRREEFETLLVYFEQCWDEAQQKERRSQSSAGRKPTLQKSEDKLFFILFYLKTYPLQEVLAHLFGMSQSVANTWIYRLSTVLKAALAKADYLPARLAEEMLERLAHEGAQPLGVDGTDRRVNRPQDNELQKTYYSGKKKAHTLKNTIIAGLVDRQIKGLGATREGRIHDKRLYQEDGLHCPSGSEVYRDSGYQGLEMADITVHQPMKKPRRGQLTAAQKKQNRDISRIRVIVEHVIAGIKRCRIVRDVFRNTRDNYADHAMELACGLHNFRSHCRLQSY